MKKVTKILFPTILASTILIPSSYALYKVCNNTAHSVSKALTKTKSSKSNDFVKMGQGTYTGNGDEKIRFKADCYYNAETGERYAEIVEFWYTQNWYHATAWYVPASVEYDGSTYPVTRINTGDKVTTYNEGLQLLSFRDACNLQEICEGSFRYESGKHGPLIYFVDFRGAYSLKTIGKKAFANQCWQSSRATGELADCINWDFSLTQLESIGDEAFCPTKTNEVAQNTFNHLILPPTFKHFGARAFDYDGDTNKILRFNRVYINTPKEDINTDTFFGSNRCLPYVIGKDSSNETGIITQNAEVLETLKKCANCYQSDGRVIKEETYALSHLSLTLKSSHENASHICGQSQLDGSDPALYRVNSLDGFNDINIKCELVLYDNSIKDKISIERTQSVIASEVCYKIKWTTGITPGIYKMYIRVYGEPTSGEAVNYANLALSEQIKLTIAQPTLSYGGETTFFIGSNIETGKCSNQFSFDYGNAYIDYSEIEAASFDFYIQPLSAEWKSTWTIEAKKTLADNYACGIFWDLTKDLSGESVGKTFVFKLIGNIETLSGCNIYATQQFSLTVTSSSYIATFSNSKLIQFSQDETEKKSANLVYQYGGEDPLLNDDPKLTFIGDDATNPSITLKKKEAQENAGEIQYEVTVDPANLAVGTYYVWVLFVLQTTSTLGYDYPLYSDVLTITKSSSDVTAPTMVDGTQTLYGKKKTCGQDSKAWRFEAQSPDETVWKIDTSINSSSGPIQFLQSNLESEMRNEYLGYTAIDNDTAFYVNWTEEFSTRNDWYDIYYTNVKVHLVDQDDTENKKCQIVMPITFVSTNNSEIITSCPSTINAMPMSEGQDSNPFKLSINGDLSLIEQDEGETLYSIDFTDSDLTANQLFLEPLPTDDKAVHLKWANNIPKGKHYFKITAYNDNYYVYATTNSYCLNVESQIELADVPTLIDVIKGQEGKTTKPISVYVNKEEASNVSFSLLNAPSGISIDQDGIISWDGTTNIGTHSIQVKATAADAEGDQISTSAILTIRVTSTGGTVVTNSWKIYAIGGGIGAVGIGLGIGGTCIVSHAKKSKLAKKSKK